jgi:hypothetical protein
MKIFKVFRLMSLVLMLFLMGGSGLARELQSSGYSEAVSANASSAANAAWFNLEVDTPGNTGQYTSMAIDPSNDNTYISYYDYTNKTLRMAMNRGSSSSGNCGPDNSWLCQTVDSTYGVGTYSSIAVYSSTGEIGISYYDATNGQLKYAHGKICPTCSWSIETIDQPILFPTDRKGKYSSLKFNSSGTPYIAYYFENTSGVDALKVAYYKGSSGNCGVGTQAGKWQCDTIQSGEGVGQYASLAIDALGNRHVAYYDGVNGDLWYAQSGNMVNCGPGNTWLCIPVDAGSDVGQYASLYVDSGYHFHIAYYDATADKLKYAVDVGSGGNCGVFGSARCETIAAMPAGYHPMGVSMAEDAGSYPVIAYQSDNGSLNLARPLAALGLVAGSGNCGPENPFSTWYCETIDRSGTWIPYRNGDFVSIALHQSGLATIAYNEFVTASDGNLAIAYQRFQVFSPAIFMDH